VDIDFLKLESVRALHEYQLATYGGIAGVRDESLLISAVSMPAAAFGGRFLHADIYEMAAAYLFHVVKNHPFLDGNKRVGAAAAATFLEMNGLQFSVAPNEYAELTLGVACGEIDKPAIAAFFRVHTRSEPA